MYLVYKDTGTTTIGEKLTSTVHSVKVRIKLTGQLNYFNMFG